MRSKFSVVCIIALLSMLLIPVLQASPETAGGTWTYVNTGFDVIKEANGNQIALVTEDGSWTGTFEGTSEDVISAVIHPKGFLTFEGLIYFEGSVDGKDGTLVILFTGDGTFSAMSGHWVIISGAEELANLHGRGTWWGPSYDLDYSGQVHFEPN